MSRRPVRRRYAGDGPSRLRLAINCRPYSGVKTTGWTTVKRLAPRKFVYLSQKVLFLFFYYTISISRPWDREEETGTLTPGQGRRDQRNQIAGKDVIDE